MLTRRFFIQSRNEMLCLLHIHSITFSIKGIYSIIKYIIIIIIILLAPELPFMWIIIYVAYSYIHSSILPVTKYNNMCL